MNINSIIENVYADIMKKHKLYKKSNNTEYKTELDDITDDIDNIFSRAAKLLKKNLFNREYLSQEELDDLLTNYFDIEKYKKVNKLDSYDDDVHNLIYYILYKNHKLKQRKYIYNDVSDNLSSYAKSLNRY